LVLVLIDQVGDGGAAGFGEVFEGDGCITGNGRFHDFSAGGVDFEVYGTGVGEADTGFVRLSLPFLRFKANLDLGAFFFKHFQFAFGFVVGAFVGGLVAQEEAELFAVHGSRIASLEEVFLQPDGALGEPVVLDEGVDEAAFGGGLRLVFGPGGFDQAFEVCAVFPSEDGEGAGGRRAESEEGASAGGSTEGGTV
jgi:hypothetical protein